MEREGERELKKCGNLHLRKRSSLPISKWKVRIGRRTDNFRAENILERVGRHSRRAKLQQITLQIFRGQMDDE
jgi:hypothetical protein